MNKQKIYIIQMHTKTIIARIIKVVTHYEYSHIAISSKKDCTETYSFGRKSLRNIFNGGFVKEHKQGKFFNKFNDTDCRIYELEVDEDKFLKIKNRLNYMEEHSNLYKYDYFGLFFRQLHIPVSYKNKYVCSTFVATLLEQSGVYKFNKEPCFVKPIDFENLKGAKQIYTGKYKEYMAS